MRNCKYRITLPQGTIYLYTWFIHWIFDVFAAAMLIFFCKIAKYVHTQNCILLHCLGWPASVAIIIWKWVSLLTRLAHLPGWLGSWYTEIFSRMEFIIFSGSPTYWDSLLHIDSSSVKAYQCFPKIIT